MVGAGASAVLLLLTWVAAFHVGFAQHADQSVFLGFADLRRPRVDSLARLLARLCDPIPFVLFGALIMFAAFKRGRTRMLLATGAILVGANVTTQVLKPLLAQPRAHWLLGALGPVGSASWPSGHATAAMSLALSAGLAAPPRRRAGVAALGGLFAVAVSYSFLTLGWHYPSDVLGGFLVAAIWTQLAVAALLTTGGREGDEVGAGEGERLPLRAALTPAAAVLGGAAVLAALVVLDRPHQVITYARAHAAFMIGAAGIVALGMALAAAMTLSMRR